MNSIKDNDGRVTEFSYDAFGRRVSKIVQNKEVKAIESKIYAYNGWSLVSERDLIFSKGRRFLWGIDLSGSLQGAGSVGGLLANIEIEDE